MLRLQIYNLAVTWPSFTFIFVSGHHRYQISICGYLWPTNCFHFQKLWLFQEKGFKSTTQMRSPFLFKYLHVLASISLHHQKKEYLRLPGYSVLSKSHSLSVSVFQHSSRDHYKHREATVGLNPIPMLLSDLHTGERWQRQKGFPAALFHLHVQNKCELSYLPAAQYSVEITNRLTNRLTFYWKKMKQGFYLTCLTHRKFNLIWYYDLQ